jgi:Spy/CpxP family protein refolding chaperone
MRFPTLLLLGYTLLLTAPALAQPAPGPAPGPAAGGKDGHGMMMGHGPGKGGKGPMGHGEEGDDDCDGESCPMHHGRGGDGDHHGMGLEKLEHLVDELGLSDAARKSVKDAIYEATKQGITLGAELAQARLELGRLMEQDKPAEDAVLKQLDKMGQLHTELMKLRVRTLLKIQALLTPEQRKKLRQHGHGMGMMDMGMGMGRH